MSNITPDNFAEFNPSMRRSLSPEKSKAGNKNLAKPEKLTKELKEIQAQQVAESADAGGDQPTASDDANNDHTSGIKNV